MITDLEVVITDLETDLETGLVVDSVMIGDAMRGAAAYS